MLRVFSEIQHKYRPSFFVCVCPCPCPCPCLCVSVRVRVHACVVVCVGCNCPHVPFRSPVLPPSPHTHFPFPVYTLPLTPFLVATGGEIPLDPHRQMFMCLYLYMHNLENVWVLSMEAETEIGLSCLLSFGVLVCYVVFGICSHACFFLASSLIERMGFFYCILFNVSSFHFLQIPCL